MYKHQPWGVGLKYRDFTIHQFHGGVIDGGHTHGGRGRALRSMKTTVQARCSWHFRVWCVRRLASSKTMFNDIARSKRFNLCSMSWWRHWSTASNFSWNSIVYSVSLVKRTARLATVCFSLCNDVSRKRLINPSFIEIRLYLNAPTRNMRLDTDWVWDRLLVGEGDVSFFWIIGFNPEMVELQVD